jgi:hypothetical protein
MSKWYKCDIVGRVPGFFWGLGARKELEAMCKTCAAHAKKADKPKKKTTKKK